jgi:hypothetical protein
MCMENTFLSTPIHPPAHIPSHLDGAECGYAALNGYMIVLSKCCNLGAVCGGVHRICILSGGKMDVVWRSL